MGADVLSYVFAGFVALLLGMIFFNILGGPRRKRRPRDRSQRWHEAQDSSGGTDPGLILRPRARQRQADGGGDDGGSDSGGDGDGGGGD